MTEFETQALAALASKYVIRKSSRWSENPTPYSGPACVSAGVTPQYYDSREDAERDAEKLSGFNPVGFEVVPSGYIVEERKVKADDQEGDQEETHEDLST